MENGLEKCTFFSAINLSNKYPEYGVVDPMALINNKNPLFYIGVEVNDILVLKLMKNILKNFGNINKIRLSVMSEKFLMMNAKSN